MNQWAMALAVLGLAGCGPLHLPPDRLERTAASIRGAEEVGAADVADAKLHLQLAKDQTEVAKKLAADGDDRALLVLSRAEADAELALTLAREVTARNEALAANDDLNAVRAAGAP
jgi:hypothetical protein